ncbi:MAG TPA: CmcI family methyltransferase [Methanocella sp.]|uniref:CmcI family methyltransferase n=1 Tax=Methanocella sp. TaxID=2052833 RepID=UPI002CB649D3|nr:CmcI family methyltransferase [Methanocella sp.]HTY91758.1 CmcI family methyltransferase [Methanocella sp.]
MEIGILITESKRLLRNVLGYNGNFKEMYNVWYYDTGVWKTTTFMGVNCLKSVSDMWNYQEIIYDLKPSLVIEFGTSQGGSTLFFSQILKLVNPDSKVISVDIDRDRISDLVKKDSHIELMNCSSTDKKVEERLRELKEIYNGPIFAIIDSDHTKKHVLAEIELLSGILIKGDYLIVEDGIVNGHPVLKGWGEGPLEAIEEYFVIHPGDFRHDIDRENKFGFTFAPAGFLIRQ